MAKNIEEEYDEVLNCLHFIVFFVQENIPKISHEMKNDNPTIRHWQIDAIDMNRSPGLNKNKVKMFGVWLDNDVAGRKAGKLARAGQGQTLSQAAVFFSEGVRAFNCGEYEIAVAILER